MYYILMTFAKNVKENKYIVGKINNLISFGPC